MDGIGCLTGVGLGHLVEKTGDMVVELTMVVVM